MSYDPFSDCVLCTAKGQPPGTWSCCPVCGAVLAFCGGHTNFADKTLERHVTTNHKGIKIAQVKIIGGSTAIIKAA